MKIFTSGRLVLVLFLLAGALTAPALAASRLALVIGNDDYVGDWRLNCCVNDAKAMAAWLKSVGYEDSEVILLPNATRAEMVEAIEALAAQAKLQHPDQVFFYYSGHGIALPDDDNDEGEQDGQDEAMVAIDDPKVAGSVDKIIVRDDLFYKHIADMTRTTGQIFIVMDCCYSGGLTKAITKDIGEKPKGKAKFIHPDEIKEAVATGKVPAGFKKVPAAGAKGIDSAPNVPKEIKNIVAERGVVFLSASNQYQLSRAGDKLSAFTAAFLSAMNDWQRLEAAHGEFSLKAVQSELTRTLFDIPQSPVLECQPKDLATAAFIPGLFPTPKKWEEEKLATQIVAQLLALPKNKQRGDWKLQVAPTLEPPLRLGEKFALEVHSNVDGYLVMFTVGASGQVQFLYPNRYRILNEIKAGQSATLPYKNGLQVAPPVGTETYYVYLLAKNPMKSFDFGKSAGAMVAGDLEGILRAYPSLRTTINRVDPAELSGARSRGMVVERVSEALRADDGSGRLFGSEGAPEWTSAVIRVQTTK